MFFFLFPAHPFITQAGLLQQSAANQLQLQQQSAMQSPSLSNQGGGGGGGGTPTPTSSAAQNVAAAFANLNSLNGCGSNSTLNSINNQQASNSNQSGQQQLLIPIMQNLNDDVSQYYIY